MTSKITLKGKTYDLEDPSDLAKVQAILVPSNWPGTKKDCVRAFQAVAAMLTADLIRALAFNWKNISKIAAEEGAEGGKAAVACSFSFEVDQSAPTVAAIGAQKLGYSAKFSTKMKPRLVDLNQAELFEKLTEGGEAMNLDEITEPPAEEKKPEAEGADSEREDAKKKPSRKKGFTPAAGSETA